MRLDRNEKNSNKYKVLKMRKLKELSEDGQATAWAAMAILAGYGILIDGNKGESDEFFVLMLKDKYANRALTYYAIACSTEDPEYSADIRELANRAGVNSPFCKKPD